MEPRTPNDFDARVIVDGLRDELHGYMGLAANLGGGAERHFTFGVGRRLLTMKRSLEVMISLNLSARKMMLERADYADLNIHLNSLYVNFRGLLDNLAWGIAFSEVVFGTVSEDNTTDQFKVRLFSDQFIAALKPRMPRTAEVLSGLGDWAKELKKIRDPIAHRIPLYAIPSILTPSDKLVMDKLTAESSEAWAKGDYETAAIKTEESCKVGTYKPWFYSDGASTPYDIWERLLVDLKNATLILKTIRTELKAVHKASS